MANGIRKFGDWNKLDVLSKTLRTGLVESCHISVKLFALSAEKIAKEHISKQDLGWKPLSAQYAKSKQKKGFSEKILVRTSTYYQSITSWREGFSGYAGVKKTVREPTGEMVADIAKIQEYGNSKTPSRPLWQPTYKEAITKWRLESTPLHIYRKKFML
jgi:hypothetical protein